MKGRINICAAIPVNLPTGVEFTGIERGTGAVALLTFLLHEPGRVSTFTVNASAVFQGAIAAEAQRISARAATPQPQPLHAS